MTDRSPRPEAATGRERESVIEFMEGLTAGDIPDTRVVPSDPAFTAFLVEEARLTGTTPALLRERIQSEGLETYITQAVSTGRLTPNEAMAVLNRHFNDVVAFLARKTQGQFNLPPGASMAEFAEMMTGNDNDLTRLIRSDPRMRWETISYTSSLDGTAPLFAEVAYENGAVDLPVIVIQHGDVVGTRYHVLESMARLAAKGFFTLAVSKRGRDGSAGRSDAWGLDVHDIYDAIEHVRTNFADIVDPTCIGIQGGSGGGIDSLLACVRFPDTFRCAGPYVGPVDFVDFLGGMDWEQMYSCVPAPVVDSAKALLGSIADHIGGTAEEVPDKYLARNGVIAAINNPYTQIHLFTDLEEGGHPPNTRSYTDFEQRARAAGFTNVHLHLSGRSSTFRFPHGGDAGVQENWYLPALRSKTLPEPLLADEGQLVVPGYVRTRPFFIRLGTGEDTVARVIYKLSPYGAARFLFKRLTATPNPSARLELANPTQRELKVSVGGKSQGRQSGSRIVVDFALEEGTVELAPVV